MNLLDYWSGTKEHVLNYWNKRSGIAALQENVSAEVDNLTIHALDPLNFSERESDERDGIRYEFYNNYPDLPTGLDIICALHPNPGVLFDKSFWWSEEDFHTGRYFGFLSQVIAEHAKNWALVALQFDDELSNQIYGTWGDVFISKLQEYGKYPGYDSNL